MRSQCSLILPASFISQCRLGWLVGYAVLYPSAAPEERRLDPARGAWSVFMQMAAVEWSRADSSTSPILHTKGHSTTDNQEAAPLFSSQGLFLLPEPGIYLIGYFLTLNQNIWHKGSSCFQNRAYIQYYWASGLFPDIETKHMA